MKPAFSPFLFVFVLFPAASLLAENWTTTDGKVYQDVTVVKVEPDAVTILDHDGGALVSLAQLPANLQKRFHYDQAKAKTAAIARAQAAVRSAQALKAEAVTATKLKATEKTAAKIAQPQPATFPAQQPVATTGHSSRDSLLNGGLNKSGSFDMSYPSRNDDRKNPGFDPHSPNLPK